MNAWLAIFIGGGVGSVLRFAVSRVLLLVQTKPLFPWATLASNLLATALLAWLIMRFNVLHTGKGTWQALLAIGLCGGFSTMSTFSYENYLLIRNWLFGFAKINVLLTVTLGIMLFYFFARTP